MKINTKSVAIAIRRAVDNCDRRADVGTTAHTITRDTLFKVAREIAAEFEHDNRKFDTRRFLAACGLECLS